MASWVKRWTAFGRWLAPMAPGRATQQRRAITARRAYLEVAAVYVLGFGLPVINAFILLQHPDRGISRHAPTLHGQLLDSALSWGVQIPGLALAGWLAYRRGWTLRRIGIAPAWATGGGRRRQAVRIAAVVFLSDLAAGIVLHTLAPSAAFPHGVTGAWGVVGGISGSIQSGVAEELVVTAFVITTLRQARRGWREILLVSLVLRVAYHVYYGTPWIAVWVAIWAGTAFLLYWRTRRLTPVIVAHALWDSLGFISLELGHVGETIVGTFYLVAFLGGFLLLVYATTMAAVRAANTPRPIPRL